MAPGYDHETLKEGLTEGRTAYVVFDSQTTGGSSISIINR